MKPGGVCMKDRQQNAGMCQRAACAGACVLHVKMPLHGSMHNVAAGFASRKCEYLHLHDTAGILNDAQPQYMATLLCTSAHAAHIAGLLVYMQVGSSQLVKTTTDRYDTCRLTCPGPVCSPSNRSRST